MNKKYLLLVENNQGNKWPFKLPNFDMQTSLYPEEKEALAKRYAHWKTNHCYQQLDQVLQRILLPIDAVQVHVKEAIYKWSIARTILLNEMHRRGTPLWAWTEKEWIEMLATDGAAFCTYHHCYRSYSRPLVLACAYLLGNFTAIQSVGTFDRVTFAAHIFSKTLVQMAINQMAAELKRMGLGPTLIDTQMPQVLVSALLISHSPKLGDISLAALEQVRNEVLPPSSRRACVTVSRALVNLGIFPHPLMYGRMGPVPQAGVDDYVSADWMAWCRRWHTTSTKALRTRNNNFTMILKIGRWLAVSYPTVTSPAQWTREMATACLAAIDRMEIGQWIHPKTTHLPTHLLGKPFRPNSKAALLAAIRTFFIDCQEWKWIPIYFDPRRTLALPRSIATLRGPNPRIMENDSWAKLLHAGLTLTADDLPVCTYRVRHQVHPRVAWYPIEMVKALVMVWLFAGLRSDEIYRLRVDCVRWQNDKLEDLQQSTPKAICLLEVPVNKTNQAFVKPVDRLVGEAIEIWQKKRPCFVPQWDSKNGELVNFLFVYRGKRFGKQYLNQSVIPMLCRKAGVPESDARGRITSHRARSTIATQLYNAREPMSLFELQEWLGHRSPSSTQQYAKIFPTKLAQAYKDAEYFSRNTRMIEVLIDQEAIQNGAATKGEPWKYYDLGHGYCTYDFFDQCAHRMACAKCSFYRPKSSSQGQLLEGKKHLQRMLQAIPLLEDERAAVEDGIEAMDKLLQRLAHQPTPSGEIPKQLAEVHMPEKT